MVAGGAIKTLIDRSYTLDEIPEAHRRVERGREATLSFWSVRWRRRRKEMDALVNLGPFLGGVGVFLAGVGVFLGGASRWTKK
jgi:hypothetical protein